MGASQSRKSFESSMALARRSRSVSLIVWWGKPTRTKTAFSTSRSSKLWWRSMAVERMIDRTATTPCARPSSFCLLGVCLHAHLGIHCSHSCPQFSFIFVLINFCSVSASFLLIRCFGRLPSSSMIFSLYLVLWSLNSKVNLFSTFPLFRIIPQLVLWSGMRQKTAPEASQAKAC